MECKLAHNSSIEDDPLREAVIRTESGGGDYSQIEIKSENQSIVKVEQMWMNGNILFLDVVIFSSSYSRFCRLGHTREPRLGIID